MQFIVVRRLLPLAITASMWTLSGRGRSQTSRTMEDNKCGRCSVRTHEAIEKIQPGTPNLGMLRIHSNSRWEDLAKTFSPL